MIACLDVYYRPDNSGHTACAVILDWVDERPYWQGVIDVPNVAPYEPGAFYKRELPCLLESLNTLPYDLDAIIIDGYVQLGKGSNAHPGLGQHLYEALKRKTPVIGVAKTYFESDSLEVRRHNTRPLFITAAGIPASDAASNIARMHGPFRIPTILKYVDTLSRG